MKQLLLATLLLLAVLPGCAGGSPPGRQEPQLPTPAARESLRPVQELFDRSLESIGADGSDWRLLAGGFSGSRPAFSPDGAVVAYEELTQNGVSLHLWDLTSGQNTVVLSGYNVFKLTWSHDGRWLAAAHEPSGTIEVQAVVLGRDGVVTASAPGHPVSWRPQHSQLLVFRGADLLLLDAETGEAHQLVEVRQAADRTAGAWSPDGRQLVYPTPAEKACPPGASPVALRVLDMETREGRQVWGPACALVLDMAWSREGDRLAVAVIEWAEQPQPGIHILHLGTGQALFLPAVGGVDSRLNWLASGHLLSLRPACYACNPGYWGLWLFDTEGQPVASWGLSADDRSYAVAVDGRRVAIGTGDGELLVLTVDGKGPRRLLDVRPFQAFGLSWAGPDRIAFVRGALWNTVSVLVGADGSGKAVPLPANARGTALSLASGRSAYVLIQPLRRTTYIADLQGARALALAQEQVEPLAWSPDGARLAVRMGREGAPQVLAVLDGDGRTLASGPPVPSIYPSLLSWSPDGRRLAWSAQEEIWLWDVEGGQVRPLGPAYPRTGQANLPLGFVAWSPDGRYLAYDGPEGLTLHELASGQKRLLAPVHPLAVAWSPDGRQLAYLGHDPLGQGMGLRVVSLENGQVREVVTSAASPEALHGEVVLRWSPQGDRLAYVSASPTLASGVEVLTVEVTTGRQQSITGPLQCRASLLDWSADGRWLAVAVDGLCV